MKECPFFSKHIRNIYKNWHGTKPQSKSQQVSKNKHLFISQLSLTKIYLSYKWTSKGNWNNICLETMIEMNKYLEQNLKSYLIALEGYS